MKRLTLILTFCFLIIIAIPTFADESDFVIDENGVLTKYNGTDSIVVIPDSVTSIGYHAFYGCSSLTDITIPDSVTSIGSSSFSGCSSLTDITIPYSVTSIGYNVFENCSNLKNVIVNIPDGVTSIEQERISVFKKYVTSVTISSSVKSIGDHAFQKFSSLNNITIPYSVTSIGNYAFYDCSSLTSITLPNRVTFIGKSSFENCSSLTSITLPNSVTSIESYTFQNCRSLTTITIPNSVTSIGYSAFYGCSSLTDITIPDSVTSIGSSSFSGCSSLTDITIPYSVTSIGLATFSSCSSLKNVTVNIPSSVTSIEKERISIFSSIVTSVTIPNSVISIGDHAFQNFSKLNNITIPSSVTSIGSSTFSGCSNLTHITIPSSVTSIGSSTFSGCSSLPHITIPDSVTSIGNYAFKDCSSLTTVTIPDSVISIGNQAFYGCSSLTSITIPNSISSIGSSTFYGCSSLTSISIPDSVTSIGEYAFSGCSSLTNISIPDSVTYIRSSAFSGCSSLTSISIPDSVTYINSYTFFGCSSLTSITIPGKVSSIGQSVFDGCNSLSTVSFPEKLTAIGEYAFRNCNLENLVLPNTLTEIGNYAFFGNTNLKAVTIPESVTSIGNRTFENCTNLAKVTLPKSVSYIGPSAFSKNTLIEVSCGSYAEQWTYENDYNTFVFCIKVEPGSLNIIGVNDLLIGKSMTIRTEFDQDPQPTNTKVTWTSKNEDVVSVSESGLVTGIKQGSSEIQACSMDNSSVCASIVLNVVDGADFVLNSDGVLTQYLGNAENINIPGGITAIGGSVFYNNASIKQVSLPEGITYIDENAFQNCTNLNKINIPKSVQWIGQYSFENCSSLKQIEIQNGVQSIGFHAFAYSGLTSIILPESVTSTGMGVFENCKDLKSAVIQGVMKTINGYLFCNCTSLEEFQIPNGATNIIYGAFENCEKLADISIPASVTSIDEQAFYGTNPTIHAEEKSYAAAWAAANNRPLNTSPINTPTPTATATQEETTPTTALTSTPPSTPTPEPTSIPAGAFSISGPDEVVAKQSIILTAEFGPEFQPENRSVSWSTSNKKFATVDGTGTVTGKKAGDVTIRACSMADYSVCASKTITVIPQGKRVNISDSDNGTGIVDLGTKGTAAEKITYQLSASVSPDDAEQEVTWSSQNTAIATVDQNGLVTAVGTGKVSIIATAADGSNKSKAFKLKVISNIQDGSISISGEDLVIQKKKVTLNVSYGQEVQPVKPKLVWSSSNPSVAKVSNKGVVTGVYGGTAVISACSAENSSYCGSFDMTVEGIASAVVINDNDNGSKLIDLGTAGTAGEKLTYSLSANVQPANVKQEVTWFSSNPSVASVDENGLVTAHTVGSVKITATSNDDAHKKNKVSLKVTSNVQPDSLTLSGPNIFGIKEAKALTAVFNQINQPVKAKVKWTSSDTKIAKVSSGTVTGVSDGTAVITVCSVDNTSVCASRTVYVGSAAAQANLSEPVTMAAASPVENAATPAGSDSVVTTPDIKPQDTVVVKEEPELAITEAPVSEPTAEILPLLQFSNEEMQLHVGERAALDIQNPDGASFMIILNGDEEALSYDESANTVTALSEGSLTAFLADIKTVQVVDTLAIQVLAAPSAPVPATAIPTAIPTTIPTATIPAPTPTAVVTAVTVSEPQFEQKEFTIRAGEILYLPVLNPNNVPVIVGVTGDTDAVIWDESARLLAAISEGEITAFVSTIDPLEVKDLCTIHVINAVTEEPTAEPTEEITVDPTDEPTAKPTEDIIVELTEEPTAEPTEEIIVELTEEPTAEPTEEIIVEPTEELTAEPTEEIIVEPTEELTAEPTEEIIVEPTEEPTAEPTEEIIVEPTEEPTAEPTEEIIIEPTEEPTAEPTEEIIVEPTEEPTAEPTEEIIVEPTEELTAEPTEEIIVEPTEEPTAEPTEEIIVEPTEEPTAEPTEVIIVEPTEEPTAEPTEEIIIESTEEPVFEEVSIPEVSIRDLPYDGLQGTLYEELTIDRDRFEISDEVFRSLRFEVENEYIARVKEESIDEMLWKGLTLQLFAEGQTWVKVYYEDNVEPVLEFSLSASAPVPEPTDEGIIDDGFAGEPDAVSDEFTEQPAEEAISDELTEQPAAEAITDELTEQPAEEALYDEFTEQPVGNNE